MPSKSINIDANLYETLKKMKGKRSFTTVIRQLLEERERLMLDIENEEIHMSYPRIIKENSI